MLVKNSMISAALGLGALPLFLACSDEPTGLHDGNRDLEVAAYIDVSPRSAEIPVGGTIQLTATIRSADGEALGYGAEWYSSDPGVATVNNGRVYGKRFGTAIITAGSNTMRAWAEVTVSRMNEEEDDVDDSVR